ncbi:hypothetical protein ACSBR2_040021 [Camellia fascicularis]
MATHFFFVTIVIMAVGSTLVFASDPSPLQDFCVAVNDSKSVVFVNGKFCNDPKLAKADDFFFSGLLTPRNTSNPIGSTVTPVNFNEGKTNAVAISGLSSQNPRVITIANAVFGSNPKISDDVLAKAFQVDKKVVDYLQPQFWWPNN